jgi:type IV fimbrial biogenesis protein FimT
MIGFTLIELMVTITLLSILISLAVPSFSLWIKNAKVRTVADTLQTGVRLAQSEAVRLNRQVVFFLTNAKGCDTTISANANGAYWAIRTVPMLAGELSAAVQCGQTAELTDGVTITGPTGLCFNSMGRQTDNATPGVTGASCTLVAGATSNYRVRTSGAHRELNVQVTLGGQTRMCDPARTLSATEPDGC